MIFTASKESPIDSDLIKRAIGWNENVNVTTYNELDSYYRGVHPILQRTKARNLKNNRIVVNHARYITKTNVGYLLGHPVDYQTKEGQGAIDKVLDQYNRQKIANIDVQVGTNASKFGRGLDYTYAYEDKELHTKSIDPRHGIIVYDDTMEHEKICGIIYSGCLGDKYPGGVIVCDEKVIYKYDENLLLIEANPHQFGKVPMVEYANNDEYMGDYEDVISMIDAYNKLQSDRVNDKEQLVEAILVLYGFKLEKDQLKDLKTNRVLSTTKQGTKAEYLIKQLNEADADTLRQVLEADIHKISMTPNLSDEKFVGNSSGVAIKYKLIAFEHNIANKERSFEKGLMERFQLYVNYLSARGAMSAVEIHDVDAVFKRSLPQNDYETSQMIANLSDVVTLKTLLSQLSFVPDAKEEAAAVEAEKLEKMNQESTMFGTPEPNEGKDVTRELNKKITEKLVNG